MTAELDGPGFMDVDMAAFCGENPLIGGKQGVDDRGIGLGSADQKIDGSIRTGAGCADSVPGALRKFIRPVAGV